MINKPQSDMNNYIEKIENLFTCLDIENFSSIKDKEEKRAIFMGLFMLISFVGFSFFSSVVINLILSFLLGSHPLYIFPLKIISAIGGVASIGTIFYFIIKKINQHSMFQTKQEKNYINSLISSRKEFIDKDFIFTIINTLEQLLPYIPETKKSIIESIEKIKKSLLENARDDLDPNLKTKAIYDNLYYLQNNWKYLLKDIQNEFHARENIETLEKEFSNWKINCSEQNEKEMNSTYLKIKEGL